MALIQKYQTPSSKKSSLAGEYTATRALNMRYGATTKYGIVSVLNKGDVFIATGQYTNNNGTPWLYGTYNGKKGFCSSHYLKKVEKPTTAKPTTKPASTTASKPASTTETKPATTTTSKPTVASKSIKAGETSANINDILEFFRSVKFAKNATYDITTALIVRSDTVIDLNGATLRRMAADNVMEAYVDPKTTTKYNGVQNVVIKNGTIAGVNDRGIRSTNLTSWMHCKNITFENVTFLDTPGCHSCDLVGCSDITFKNCKFLGYCSDGGDFRESIQIDYAAYGSLPSYPLRSKCYDMTYCKNIVIDGCIFDKSENYPAQYCAIGAHSQGNDNHYHENITIKNCTATGNGITKGSPAYGAFVRCMKFKNTLIENNTVSNYGRMVWITMPQSLMNPNGTSVKAADFPEKVVNVEGLKILNNKILTHAGWKTYAVYIKDTFKKSKDITIEGLNVPKTAVYISGCENVSIKL